MSNSAVAKRYAQALFELAQQKNILAEVGADLNELTKIVKESPDLLTLLNAPKFSIGRKKQMVAEIFAGATPEVLRAVQLLVEKKRVNEVKLIANAYAELAAKAQGTADATVFSTRALSAEESANISTTFAKLVGKQSLNITNEIDPSLLGGIRVQIGNHIYDSSVANKLERLKRELIG
ncbi:MULTISPECIES: F0F1 ATP synthase subunit delta [Lysinibacillus]|uniref:F0F1 ATP synthase subunit delta n=1 Tax=Lysinibacillus TaxID=400634 RepID=UPI000881EF27|nr:MULTISPECIES: F0F1 ATP synthase subunit delta [Lysinibacillus]HAU33771.1 F0F1 ATP synthase subunit delta [Lysinibacillus sp.]MED4668219.1 F0F1 ATP synthase subunit delta [Lysinibacillus fusiformis]QAS58616.1 F0F1 ATP synthase subunit delta [Lysinibacillus sphaericus]RDV35386.1 F0F1 ATP synthase subunit delta [Lysinibacillus fusiformis]SCX64930.1 ATP synthase F1 subcomplex delta subunit [Lysinibacillus fusiformis]